MNQFDPSYGYTLSSLLEVESPVSPGDFAQFWQSSFTTTTQLDASPETTPTGKVAAYLFLCYRGLAKSRLDGIPEEPQYHVLYDLHDKDNYILRGCVEDTWMAISAAEALFPEAKDHIGFMGISFSGGIGALAIPWDKRIKKAHLHVPSFGHHPLRMSLPTWGSANAVQDFQKHNPNVLETLRYYDAAIAAGYSDIPVHIAAALADPFVAPPGQFAIYNNLSSHKELFVLEKGHTDYPGHLSDQAHLLRNLEVFFKDL